MKPLRLIREYEQVRIRKRQEKALEEIRLRHEKDDIATSPIVGEHSLPVDEVLEREDVGRCLGLK